MGFLDALKQSFLGASPPIAPEPTELDPPFRFMFGTHGPVPDVPIPADADQLMDRWVDTWMQLVNELRTSPDQITAATRRRWQQARPIVVVHPAIADSGMVMALESRRGEDVFFRNRLGFRNANFPTFDRAWLAHRRAQDAAWPGDGLNWAGVSVPGRQALAAIALGPHSLVEFLQFMHSPKPPAKWAAQAAGFASGPQGPAIRQAITDWLATLPVGNGAARARLWPDVAAHRSFRSRVVAQTRLVGSPESAALLCFFNSMMSTMIHEDGSGDFWFDASDPAMLSTDLASLTRAAIWMLAHWPDADAVATIQATAEACLVRLAAERCRVNYRSLTVANACILVLGEIGTADAVQALGRLKLGIRDERLSKQIASAMEAASKRAGMAVEDLQELSVPTFDLEDGGIRSVSLGEVQATLRVLSTTDVDIGFTRTDGKAVKAVPAAVKADKEASAALKALKTQAKAIAEALPVHRQRIEQLYLTRRAWPLATWRARYLDHPLVGTLARRLIWTVTAAGGSARSVMWHDGRLADATGAAATDLADDSAVTLWHPLEADAADVAAWRAFLVRHQVTQPFKQAHRETYPITDAERHAETYSNRFAGHILRQHQGVALARLRGWRATMRISADVANDEPTHLRVADFELAGELWTEGTGDTETTGSQAYVYLSTDRVRFRRLVRTVGGHVGLGDPVPLDTVPSRIFSEVMRDVDLMVGVASIGNDPNWRDAGPAAEHPNQWRRNADDYWTNYAGGAIGIGGDARRQVLADLIPSLAIADRCTLDDRHLIVRGKLRTYRIHLGSGNILMDGDRYLCIVPKPAAQDPVVLPFEGDNMLSIILSKAIMLAADDKIADEWIRTQIRG